MAEELKTGAAVYDPMNRKNSRDLLRNVAEYLSVRPLTNKGRVLLFSCYLSAVAGRTFRLRNYVTPGQYLRRDIVVRRGKMLFTVRARSDDLNMILLSHKVAVEKWFAPRPNDLVLDVGSHIGCYTIGSALAGAKVIAVEPNPTLAACLDTNLRLNSISQVRVVHAAAGSSAGIAVLNVPPIFGSLGSLRADWAWTSRASPRDDAYGYEVEVTPLDELTFIGGRDVVDWLLIDVEGSELDVLKGATKVLARTRRVILEVADGPNVSRCEELLQAAGLRILEKMRQSPRTSYWLASRELD
jgi:FkbM family methyltransferase